MNSARHDAATRQLNYEPGDVEQLRRSVRTFGFGCLPAAIAPTVLQKLQIEARERYSLAVFADQSAELSYRANLVSLGPEAAGLLSGMEARELMYSVFGQQVELSAGVSCLTYYREGDYLGPHLDQPAEQCVVTALVYLSATAAASPSSGTGLVLRVYGEEAPAGREPILTIPTLAGALVVGRGSKVWHERPVLQPGEQVMAITGCYALA
jgi:hypothetical protein